MQVFSKADLEHVAHLVEKYNAYAVLDEVYEHLVFDGAEHLTMRSLPGMARRAIRIGSAGKTFSFTGWKVEAFLSSLGSSLQHWKISYSPELESLQINLALLSAYGTAFQDIKVSKEILVTWYQGRDMSF